MEKQSIDYSALARTNPVFMTAKTAVCLMAQAGIPDAAEIVHRLELGSAEEVSGIKDYGTILGNELVVEAKYRTMCSLIEASGYSINVDLPCGYTPKALHLTAKGLRFIGLDLPIVAGEAGPILSALARHPDRMHFEGVDATNPDSLVAALKDVQEPICLTTEGMMMYFTDNEVNAVIANVRSLLETHGGCWITPDPEYILQFMLTFKAVLGEAAVQKLMSSRDAASGQSDAGSLTNAFIVSPMDIPASTERVTTLLAVHGLKVKRVNLAEHMPELSVYQKLTAEQVEAFKAEMHGCHYWVITPDENWKGKGSNISQTESAFSLDYHLTDGVFIASLQGRMDTITAPELLKAWEKETATGAIAEAEINCTRLQYISSAGLRVLMIMKKSGAKVRLTGVNDEVLEILNTTGFIDIFDIVSKSMK